VFNKTPVLDIKPWLPSIDCPGWKMNLDIEEKLGLKTKLDPLFDMHSNFLNNNF